MHDIIELIPKWYSDAACANMAPMFDGAGSEGHHATNQDLAVERAALAVCWRSCPVRSECLLDALENNVEYTLRGGYTPKQRQRILRKVPKEDWHTL